MLNYMIYMHTSLLAKCFLISMGCAAFDLTYIPLRRQHIGMSSYISFLVVLPRYIGLLLQYSNNMLDGLAHWCHTYVAGKQ